MSYPLIYSSPPPSPSRWLGRPGAEAVLRAGQSAMGEHGAAYKIGTVKEVFGVVRGSVAIVDMFTRTYKYQGMLYISPVVTKGSHLLLLHILKVITNCKPNP